MAKKNKPNFRFNPYRLNNMYKNSYEEVAQEDLPEFFKQLGKFMKKNPHLTLEDLRMNYAYYDENSVYIMEGVWMDESEVLDYEGLH